MIEGMSIEEAQALKKNEIAQAVGGLPSRKHHAAALAIETLQSALGKHRSLSD
jgi:NifU-like protein involved in Fe-S cluster formation